MEPKDIERLKTVIDSLASKETLKESLKGIVDVILAFEELAAVSIWLKQGEDKIRCEEASGTHAQEILGWEVELGEGLVGRVAKFNAMETIDASSPIHAEEIDEAIGFLSGDLAAYPLKSAEGECYGVIEFIGYPEVQGIFNDRAFSSLLAEIAQLTGIALHDKHLSNNQC